MRRPSEREVPDRSPDVPISDEIVHAAHGPTPVQPRDVRRGDAGGPSELSQIGTSSLPLRKMPPLHFRPLVCQSDEAQENDGTRHLTRHFHAPGAPRGAESMKKEWEKGYHEGDAACSLLCLAVASARWGCEDEERKWRKLRPSISSQSASIFSTRNVDKLWKNPQFHSLMILLQSVTMVKIVQTSISKRSRTREGENLPSYARPMKEISRASGAVTMVSSDARRTPEAT